MDLTTSQPPMQPNFGHELANSLSGQIWWPSFCFNTAKNFKNFEDNITSTKAKKSYPFANFYSQSNLKIAVQATIAARDCVCLCSNSIHSRNLVEQTRTREQGALKKTVIVFFVSVSALLSLSFTLVFLRYASPSAFAYMHVRHVRYASGHSWIF